MIADPPQQPDFRVVHQFPDDCGWWVGGGWWVVVGGWWVVGGRWRALRSKYQLVVVLVRLCAAFDTNLLLFLKLTQNGAVFLIDLFNLSFDNFLVSSKQTPRLVKERFQTLDS